MDSNLIYIPIILFTIAFIVMIALNIIRKKTLVSGTCEDQMRIYLKKVIQDFDDKQFAYVYASTTNAAGDIMRVVAYNDKQILVIPAKSLINGALSMPSDQQSLNISVNEIQNIEVFRKESIIHMPTVSITFDNYEFSIHQHKKDFLGKDNHESFKKFMDYAEKLATKINPS